MSFAEAGIAPGSRKGGGQQGAWAPPGYDGPGQAMHTLARLSGRLLLVDDEACSRSRMQRSLASAAFAVTGVGSAREALEAAADSRFSHGVVELRLGRSSGLQLIAELRALQTAIRIVVVTGFDSFASVILALRAGAVDYLAKPVDGGELIDALLGRASTSPPVPATLLGLDRISWEHTQRVFEQCDRNVTRTAHRLGMHRRTLQRMLIKRSPPSRGPPLR